MSIQRFIVSATTSRAPSAGGSSWSSTECWIEGAMFARNTTGARRCASERRGVNVSSTFKSVWSVVAAFIAPS